MSNRFRLKTVQYAQNCIPFISLQPGESLWLVSAECIYCHMHFMWCSCAHSSYHMQRISTVTWTACEHHMHCHMHITSSLQCTCAGIRYVPLRTPGGTLIPESGIFVRITKRGGAYPESPVPHPQSSVPDHRYPDPEPEAQLQLTRSNSGASLVAGNGISDSNHVVLRSKRLTNGSQRHSIKADIESSFSTPYAPM